MEDNRIREKVDGVIRKEGKVYEGVIEALKDRGLDTIGIEVLTGNKGPYHYILQNGEVIGDYNHSSKRIILYSDTVKESG